MYLFIADVVGFPSTEQLRNLEDMETVELAPFELDTFWAFFKKYYVPHSPDFFGRCTKEDFMDTVRRMARDGNRILIYNMHTPTSFVADTLAQPLGESFCIQSSRFRHSCLPDVVLSDNKEYGAVGQWLLLPGVKMSERKVDDLTVCRIGNYAPLQTTERRAARLEQGFVTYTVCKCPLCLDEKANKLKQFGLAKETCTDWTQKHKNIQNRLLLVLSMKNRFELYSLLLGGRRGIILHLAFLGLYHYWRCRCPIEIFHVMIMEAVYSDHLLAATSPL